MMTWHVVTRDKRWTATDHDALAARIVALLVDTELRLYREAEGEPLTVTVHQVFLDREGRTHAECAGGSGLPVCTFGRGTMVYQPVVHEVPAQFAPWVRALDTPEIFDYLEQGGYAK